MSFKSGKESDRLWRSLLFEVKQRTFIINAVIFLLAMILVILNYTFDLFEIPDHIVICIGLMTSAIINAFIDIKVFEKILCKYIEKQQETIDLLMLKAGLSNASAFTNVDKKEELVEALCKLVFVSDVATRCCITESLGELGGSTASKTLKQLLLDTDDKVRSKAKLSLERLSLKI